MSYGVVKCINMIGGNTVTLPFSTSRISFRAPPTHFVIMRRSSVIESIIGWYNSGEYIFRAAVQWGSTALVYDTILWVSRTKHGSLQYWEKLARPSWDISSFSFSKALKSTISLTLKRCRIFFWLISLFRERKKNYFEWEIQIFEHFWRPLKLFQNQELTWNYNFSVFF